MECMFSECHELTKLPNVLSYLNTKNITDMSGIIENSFSLTSLPDISKWDTTNVINMSFMFSYCTSFTFIPDISN